MEVVVGGVVKYPKIKLTPTTSTTLQRKKKIQMTFNDEIKIAGDVKFRFKSKVKTAFYLVFAAIDRNLFRPS